MSAQTPTCEASNEGDTSSADANPQDENDPVVQLKPILEAQEKHGPIFRRELFDVAYAAHCAINDDDPDEQVYMKDGQQSRLLRTKATLLDINGIKCKSLVPRACMKGQNGKKSFVMRRAWRYNSLQNLGLMYAQGYFKDLLPIQFMQVDYGVKEESHSSAAQIEDKVAGCRTEWTTSEMYHRLTTLLEENAGHTMHRVDQIICFGLDCPISRSQVKKSFGRSYVQHLAACTIRDILARKQGGVAPIVYAQDPVYNSTSIDFFSKHFGITVLSDPEGFRALNGNTFVVTVAPNVPVRQIALDMTAEYGGPVGFFCNAIHNDGLDCDGKGMGDGSQRRVTPFTTCPSSPGLWKYKEKGIWMEYNDREESDLFGDMGMYLKRREGTY
jgi:hypothetical protein